MKILLIVLAVSGGLNAIGGLMIWIMTKTISSYRRKLKAAEWQMSELNAAYLNLKKIKDGTSEKIEKLDDVAACVDYFNSLLEQSEKN